MFWVGRFAAAKVTGHGEDLAAAEDDGREDQDDACDAAYSRCRNCAGSREWSR